ncbi:hypothetical protein P1P75_33420 [Streptomyces sp. ID05-39B]|uniref:hypothetical protein n=1 Tax=Streptomyces sp. ID05-39B TaxID=3028664 RepID=UPI0029B70462|nr:hypothetical protein [Streptomyces sp. ID05-39B]MDX3531174.1 hypothetical protein [Streptomyces sp. ID05-39B]
MLRSVPAPAQEQRPKKTFPEFVAAVYEDPRVGHEARELLLAIGYAVDLAKREDGVSPLKVARRKLGVEHGRMARYDRLVASDAPRYKPPHAAGNWGPSGAPGCQAPRLRPYVFRARQTPSPLDDEAVVLLRPRPETVVHVGPDHVDPVDYRNEHGICGANSHHRVLEKDPRTGWVTAHWFCKRHKDHADRVDDQVRAQNEQAPEPIPNIGGLLPCYFKADWEKVYKHYRPHWTAPKYGLCADDWPTVDEAAPRTYGRLRAINGLDLEDA